MANVRTLSSSGANQAAQENGYDDEHDMKNSWQCGKSEYNIAVDIDTNEVVFTSVKGDKPNVSTGMKTTAR